VKDFSVTFAKNGKKIIGFKEELVPNIACRCILLKAIST